MPTFSRHPFKKVSCMIIFIFFTIIATLNTECKELESTNHDCDSFSYFFFF